MNEVGLRNVGELEESDLWREAIVEAEYAIKQFHASSRLKKNIPHRLISHYRFQRTDFIDTDGEDGAGATWNKAKAMAKRIYLKASQIEAVKNKLVNEANIWNKAIERIDSAISLVQQAAEVGSPGNEEMIIMIVKDSTRHLQKT